MGTTVQPLRGTAIPGLPLDGDVHLLVDAMMGQRILNAVMWPVRLRFPAEGKGERALLMPAGVAAGAPAGVMTEVPVDIVEVSESTASSTAVEIPELSQHIDKVLRNLATGPAATLGTGSLVPSGPPAPQSLRDFVAGSPQPATAKAAKEFAMNALSKGALSVSINWVTAEVKKPDLTLKNPIKLSNAECTLQAQFKACIYGHCVSPTTPKVTITGRTIELRLGAKDGVVTGVPSVDDVDITIKVKILSWLFDVRIGVTKVINAALAAMAPIALFDLKALEQTIPYSTKKLKIGMVAFPAVQQGLMINTGMQIV